MKNLCLLCRKNVASNIKSHIVPKFLGKDLINENQMLVLSKDDKIYKTSDLPKRSGLFCTKCESSFSSVEGISARILNDIRRKNYDFFEVVYVTVDKSILKMKSNKVPVFNLFLLSIIWRVSVSNDKLYESINLSKKVEEKIRKILKTNLKQKASDYTNFSDSNYDNFIIYFKNPISALESTRGSMSFSNPSKGMYIFNFPYFQLSLIEMKVSDFNPETSFNHNLETLLIETIGNRDFYNENIFNVSKFRFSNETISKIRNKKK